MRQAVVYELGRIGVTVDLIECSPDDAALRNVADMAIRDLKRALDEKGLECQGIVADVQITLTAMVYRRGEGTST